jgi:4-amino-4-deoxy-L-arabinose transferase-like glycosyltransferase
LLASLLLVAARLLSYEIDRPWVGLHDFNGAVWSNVARNYNRYGFAATRFGQVNNYGSLTPKTFSFYIHHPPLLPILVALSFRIFGESEASARYVPIVFSLGALVFVFLISKHFWGTLGASIASTALVATPHYLYLGRMVNHEPLTFFFIMGAAYFYALWRDSASRLSYALFAAFLIGGSLSGWPMFIFIGSVFLLDVVLERRVCKETLVLPLVGLVLFGLFLVHVSLLKGWESASADLVSIARTRTGQAPVASTGEYDWVKVPGRVYFWLTLEFTWPMLALSLLGTAAIAFVRSSRSRLFLGLVLTLLVVALLFIVIFPQGAWHHDYWVFYFLGPFALSAAVLGSLSFAKKWLNLAALMVSGVLVGALVLVGVPVTSYLHNFAIDYRFKVVGEAIRSQTDEGTIVITNLPLLVEANYYADREIVVEVKSFEELERIMGKYQDKEVVFLDTGVPGEFRALLASRYSSEPVPSIGGWLYHLTRK